MTEPSTPLRSDNPIVERLLAGTAPPAIKLAAARGALPITAEEQLHVLHAISSDPDPELQKALAATIDSYPDEALAEQLRGARVNAPVLDFFAHRGGAKPLTLTAIASSRAVSDDTLAHLARTAPAETLELIVTNQVALIRAPSILDGLLENAQTSVDQRRRVLEVREEFFLKKEREERRRRDEEERLARLREKKEWSLSELEKLQDDLAKEAQVDQAAGTLPGDEEETAVETEEAYQSASQRIMQMTIPEKVLLAIRGNRTERNLLVRDANRLVAASVLKSPKANEKDIEFYASQRNVSDEILRLIGNRREWTRNYSIVHTLVKNPRTPIAISMNLLPRLQGRDLKLLEGDRGVSETLRRQAKNLLAKGQKTGAR